MIQTFLVHSDRDIVVAFEPTAQTVRLAAGDSLTVRWEGDAEDGMVSLEAGRLVIHAPSAGISRVWDSSGTERWIGPGSGADAK